jgi:predicted RNase H-like HicB family nuclease
MSLKYAVVLEKAANNWAAYVPDLPGCITTAHTLAEAEVNIRDAIQGHLNPTRVRRDRPRAIDCDKGDRSHVRGLRIERNSLGSPGRIRRGKRETLPNPRTQIPTGFRNDRAHSKHLQAALPGGPLLGGYAACQFFCS